MIHRRNLRAIELSALREPELIGLVEGLHDLDLSEFNYIAVHAPSQIKREHEEGVVQLLVRVSRYSWPIVVHPDAMHKPRLWKCLGEVLCIENTDKRKLVGRTAGELMSVFREFPEAGFCFDIGHAWQVDSTMTEAYLLLKAFGGRLRQVHVSEVNTRSKHDPLSYASITAFKGIAHLIPDDVPIILETPVPEEQIELQIKRAMEALPLCREAALTR
ncbi:MAG: TIM barrel protein [Acidobacteriota bacterium]